MDLQQIRELTDLGGTVIVTAMLWMVWTRLNTLTDRLIDILSELRDQQLISRLPGSSEINKH